MRHVGSPPRTIFEHSATSLMPSLQDGGQVGHAFPGFHPGLFSLAPSGSKKTNPEAFASGFAEYMLAYERTEYIGCPLIGALSQAPLKLSSPPFRFHQIGQNIVAPRQVPLALGAQPLQHIRIKPNANRHLPLHIPKPHHPRQLLGCQSRNIFVFLFGQIDARALRFSSPAHCLDLRLSPLPVPDIF